MTSNDPMSRFIGFEQEINEALASGRPIDADMRETIVAYMGGLKFTICALMDILKDRAEPGGIGADLVRMVKGSLVEGKPRRPDNPDSAMAS